MYSLFKLLCLRNYSILSNTINFTKELTTKLGEPKEQ